MHSTRREFLAAGASAVVAVGSGSAPAFLLDAAAAEPSSGQETVLVVLQLSGGNDGLNTVVPFADEDYRRSRPALAISKNDVLKINDELGLHPSMRGMSELLESGQLAIIQGVGYPNPNRSHFESMDIWHTCRRKGEPRSTGWLGRYLDVARQTAGRDLPGIHLGKNKQPLALAAREVRVPSIRSLERFRLDDRGNQTLRSAINQLSQSQDSASDGLLDFIQSSTTSALQASRRVETASQQYKTAATYPDSSLAEKLRTTAQLIDAGLRTRVYYMQLDGFDTHSQQSPAHQALLKQLSDAVRVFIEDLDEHGHGDRVAVMVFSEFGRRVKENASGGTDHGAAAPMFLAGTKVRPGLIGKHPSLTDLRDGDLQHHTDFRQVYAAVLEQWLGWSSQQVIGAQFEPVAAFQSSV